MKIVAFDPFIAPEQARDAEIELAPLEELFASADFITVHTPLTAETRGVIGQDAFAKMKKGVRIINCARGGLVDEGALYDAIKSGQWLEPRWMYLLASHHQPTIRCCCSMK